VTYTNTQLHAAVTAAVGATTPVATPVEPAHNYCGKKDGEQCRLTVELLMHPSRAASSTWASADKFVSYKKPTEEILHKDIYNAVIADSLDVASKTTKSDVKMAASLETVKYDTITTDTVVMDHSVLTEHHGHSSQNNENTNAHAGQTPPGQSHRSVHRHHDESFAVYCAVSLRGDSKQVNAAVGVLLQQLSDTSSLLHGGLITSHLRANYLRIISHSVDAKTASAGVTSGGLLLSVGSYLSSLFTPPPVEVASISDLSVAGEALSVSGLLLMDQKSPNRFVYFAAYLMIFAALYFLVSAVYRSFKGKQQHLPTNVSRIQQQQSKTGLPVHVNNGDTSVKLRR
jgi:hypothetical protein